MKTIKLFEQFVKESKDSAFSHTVLSALEPTIIDMLARIKERIIEDHNKKGINYQFNEWEEENLRLSLIIDMLKSFEKYTEPTDKLIKIQPKVGSKGIEIYATIERDGIEYNYYTDAIGAGGYNIQSFHYRYLTKTGLPVGKIKNTLADEYAKKLKSLNKAEKLNADIKKFEKVTMEVEAKLAEYIGWTDEQIADELKATDHYTHNNPTWNEIVSRGADKNYEYNEDVYNASVVKIEAHGIDLWKKQNINWPTERINSLNKEIKKLQAKLQTIL